MDIHRVVSGDWQALRAVRLSALRDAPQAFASTYDRESAWPDEDWRSWASASEIGERQATFMARIGPRWTGLAFGVLPDDGVTADLYGVWVDPAHRRRGVGRALAQTIIDWAKSNNRRTVRLEVASGNLPAFGLYEAIGFRASGNSQPLPSNPAVSEVELLLALQPECVRG